MTREYATYIRMPEMDGLELLHAEYHRHQFSPHYHEGHVIGVIEKGHLGFDYRGEKLVASRGQINLADPGEVHNGFPVSDGGWQYRMFYLSRGQMEAILQDGTDKRLPAPAFKKGVIRDPALAREIVCLHRDFEDPCISLMEKQTRFYLLVRHLVDRHAPEKTVPLPKGKERTAVAKIKAFLDENFHDPVGLEDLSRITGMSRFYLVRVFAAQTGLTPHAWLTQVRAKKARQMMDRGMALADVAVSSGFFDQSHMNRIFKKVFGITPGQYSTAAAGVNHGSTPMI